MPERRVYSGPVVCVMQRRRGRRADRIYLELLEDAPEQEVFLLKKKACELVWEGDNKQTCEERLTTTNTGQAKAGSLLARPEEELR